MNYTVRTSLISQKFVHIVIGKILENLSNFNLNLQSDCYFFKR